MCPIVGESNGWSGTGFGDLGRWTHWHGARYAIGESEAADNHQLRFDEEPKQIARFQRGQRCCREWCGASDDRSGGMHKQKDYTMLGDKDQYGPEGPVSSL